MKSRVLVPLVTTLTLLVSQGICLAAIEAGDAWTGPVTSGATVAAGYLTLRNTGNARRELLKVTSPLVDTIVLQQSSLDAQGVEHQWPVGKLELAPGEVLRLTPSGKHLLLIGMRGPLPVGERVPVTFVFEDEPPLTVHLLVRPAPRLTSATGR